MITTETTIRIQIMINQEMLPYFAITVEKVDILVEIVGAKAFVFNAK